MERPLCSECKKQPCAVNYKKQGKTFYRSKCNKCNGKRKKPYVPRWRQKGYKQKTVCDRCGFRAKYPSQIVVFHINGDLNDATITNLSSVCLKCVVDIDKQDLPWKQGDLTQDF
jgi:SRSO17 transposase